MDSLVIDLQRECLDPSVLTLHVLRKALVVAKKLGIAEFQVWINKEIEGYQRGDKVPDYRVVRGAIKAWNPYRGWIDIMVGDPKVVEKLSVRAVGQGIGELDTVVKDSAGGCCHIHFQPEIEAKLLQGMYPKLKPSLEVNGATVKGITDRVRDIVLNWSLDLEAKGVLGEGMTFSEREKKTASRGDYHVHYHGNVATSQVQQGTVSSSQSVVMELNLDEVKNLVAAIRNQLVELTLTGERQRQLMADLASIEAQLSAPQPGRGAVAECLSSVRNILEGCVGSLAASALLQQMAKLWQ